MLVNYVSTDVVPEFQTLADLSRQLLVFFPQALSSALATLGIATASGLRVSKSHRDYYLQALFVSFPFYMYM